MSGATCTALDSHTVGGAIAFDGGHAELRDYHWRHPTQDLWSSKGYFLHLRLSDQSAWPTATYLDCERHVAGPVGQLLIVPPGHTVRSGGAHGRQRSLHCLLSPALVEDAMAQAPRWTDATLRQGLCLNSAEVRHLLLKLYGQIKAPDFGAGILAESLAAALGRALVRSFGFAGVERASQCGGLAPWRMHRICEQIHDAETLPSLAQLAASCGLSVRQLTRAFRAETGQSVAQYVARTRIDRAITLLASAGTSTADIARKTGFSSTAAFSHAFRRSTGVRPSDIRHRIKP